MESRSGGGRTGCRVPYRTEFLLRHALSTITRASQESGISVALQQKWFALLLRGIDLGSPIKPLSADVRGQHVYVKRQLTCERNGPARGRDSVDRHGMRLDARIHVPSSPRAWLLGPGLAAEREGERRYRWSP